MPPPPGLPLSLVPFSCSRSPFSLVPLFPLSPHPSPLPPRGHGHPLLFILHNFPPTINKLSHGLPLLIWALHAGAMEQISLSRVASNPLQGNLSALPVMVTSKPSQAKDIHPHRSQPSSSFPSFPFGQGLDPALQLPTLLTALPQHPEVSKT